MDGIELAPSYLIPADELVAQSPVRVTILPDVRTLDEHFATAVATEIAANHAQG